MAQSELSDRRGVVVSSRAIPGRCESVGGQDGQGRAEGQETFREGECGLTSSAIAMG